MKKFYLVFCTTFLSFSAFAEVEEGTGQPATTQLTEWLGWLAGWWPF